MFSKVGIVGLGRMGLAMAERFKETGQIVIGTDIMEGARESARKAGIETVDSAEQVFQTADIVFLSLPKAQDVEAAVASLLAGGAKKVTHIVDTTSSDPVVTRRLHNELGNHGVRLVDAPVSGGFFGARAGTLGIMVGGDEVDFNTVLPILEKIGKNIVLMGPTGAGHATKLLNNLLGAANLIVATELMKVADSQQLDREKLIGALNSGTAKNSATEFNYPKWILNRDFTSGFSMRLMRKDVGLAGQLVDATPADLSLLSKVTSIWADSAPAISDDADFNEIVDFYPSA